MTDSPIIFSAPMIRALLAGAKTSPPARCFATRPTCSLRLTANAAPLRIARGLR